MRTGIVSIGYEGRSVEELLDILEANLVEVLVDVRLNPISRKRGLSKTALREALDKRGIGYVHERDLGNPKDNREPFVTGDLPRGRRRYFARLDNSAAFDRVMGLVRAHTVALLCFEHDERQCHRQCIVERALARDSSVRVVRV
jgi:uncharacterized protein (DUF488 family)